MSLTGWWLAEAAANAVPQQPCSSGLPTPLRGHGRTPTLALAPTCPLLSHLLPPTPPSRPQGCAAATLALTTLTGNVLGMIGSLCATLAAATHRCKCCRPAMVGDDLGALVQRVFSLAVAAATLCGIVATLTLLIAFDLSAAYVGADNGVGVGVVALQCGASAACTPATAVKHGPQQSIAAGPTLPTTAAAGPTLGNDAGALPSTARSSASTAPK